MPGFNKTGPSGQGPMTGRKMGKCSNQKQTEKNLQIHEESQAPIISQKFNDIGMRQRRGSNSKNCGNQKRNRFNGD